MARHLLPKSALTLDRHRCRAGGRLTRPTWLGPSPDPAQPLRRRGPRRTHQQSRRAAALRQCPGHALVSAPGTRRAGTLRPGARPGCRSGAVTRRSTEEEPPAPRVGRAVRLAASDHPQQLSPAGGYRRHDLSARRAANTDWPAHRRRHRLRRPPTLELAEPGAGNLVREPAQRSAAVSPMNLEGHKLDLSLAARLRLHRRISLQLTVGNTFALFEPGSGAFSSDWALGCRASGYDITGDACQRVQAGWSLPSATGVISCSCLHGIAGPELNLCRANALPNLARSQKSFSFADSDCFMLSQRGVAQSGSAPALGAGCRRFKSSRPDPFGSPWAVPRLQRRGVRGERYAAELGAGAAVAEPHPRRARGVVAGDGRRS